MIFRFHELQNAELERLLSLAESIFGATAEKSIAHDLAAIARLSELEELSKLIEKRERELNDATKKVDAHKARLAEIKEEQRAFDTAQARWRESRGSSSEIIGLKQSNPDLFPSESDF